jgi:hypothetical protein
MKRKTCLLFLPAGFLLALLFDPENGGDMILRNISCLLPDYMVLHPRRQKSSRAQTFLFATRLLLPKRV